METINRTTARAVTMFALLAFFLFVCTPGAYAAAPQPEQIDKATYNQILSAAKSAGISEDQVKKDIKKAEAVKDLNKISLATGATASVQTNGCSNPVPGHGYQNAFFDNDCNVHDVCYSAEGNNGRSREQCDNEFRANMVATCKRTYADNDIEQKRCIGTASYYYGFVRAFGAGRFKG